MMRLLFAAAALAASPAAAQSVESAEGDWANIPYAVSAKKYGFPNETIAKLENVAASGACPAIGNRRQLRLDMPFLLQFGASGAVERIVVRKVGCPEVEELVGGAVMRLARAGAYRPTGQNQSGWYRSTVAVDMAM